MIQENNRWTRVNWRWVIVTGLVVGALLLTTGGVLAYTGAWSAWFDRGSAGGELFQPAGGQESLPPAPGLNEGAPFDSRMPSGGGGGCEHENPNTLPQGLD